MKNALHVQTPAKLEKPVLTAPGRNARTNGKNGVSVRLLTALAILVLSGCTVTVTTETEKQCWIKSPKLWELARK